MGAVLRFKARKSLLELNQDEIERATADRLKAYEVLRRINADLAALRLERERLCRELRKR